MSVGKMEALHGPHCKCKACFEEWAEETGFNQLRINPNGSRGAQPVWEDGPAASFREDDK